MDEALSSSSTLPRSDATTAIQRVAMNQQYGKKLVFTLLEQRLEEIISNINGGLNPIASIVGTLSTYINSQEDRNRVLNML